MKKQTKTGEQVNKGFEDLKAWQLARKLIIECHEVVKTLPAHERFDLSSQMRRSSKSVMANIAEGYGRYHYLDSLRFYYIARGSLDETISHIITVCDLHYIGDPRYQELYDLAREAERTLNGYVAYVWKQKQGSTHYGDHFIVDATDDTPLPSEPTAG